MSNAASTSNPVEAAVPEFTITRTFDAPRELVFRAWIEPEQMTRWWGPHHYTTPESTISVDARPGGQWRATMISESDGAEWQTGGEFREIVEPERLVFTWGGVDESGKPDHGTLITVTLAEQGSGTEMTFHLSGIAGHPGDENVYDGWAECLERLAGYLVRDSGS
ncbi:SRPBCC domain-containing protein [Haloechinothrix sp. LS1_15]|uniref:SRPBCC family protein n=1 Tax=Haloechinothrix sp. LS1_15 TaxID=2652248 RepID=UPI00294638B6|nr:SRPBCC domain-containing protein [Haloechinothrix sp. LS1_15]MDV6014719.1 SRPBCC domain-containing protein [Haloechinothrix sp. LS1_15]